MPQWVVVLVIAVAGWLAVCVFGGFLVGRLMDVVSRLVGRRGTELDVLDEVPRPAPGRRAA